MGFGMRQLERAVAWVGGASCHGGEHPRDCSQKRMLGVFEYECVVRHAADSKTKSMKTPCPPDSTPLEKCARDGLRTPTFARHRPHLKRALEA